MSPVEPRGVRRALVPVLLSVLVCLSGCGAPGGAGGGPTGSPAAEGGEEATPDPDRLAPGLTADGVRNATALGEAHRAILRARPATQSLTTTSRHPNGTVRGRSRAVLRATPSRELRRATYVGAATFRNRTAVAAWANGTVRAVRLRYANGTTRYRAERAPLYLNGPPGSVYARALGDGGGRVVGEREVDGTTAYVLRSDSPAVEGVAGVDGPTRNASMRVVVTADGLVRSATLRFETREPLFTAGDGAGSPGEWRSATVAFRARRLAETTVGRPAWVDTALRRGDG